MKTKTDEHIMELVAAGALEHLSILFNRYHKHVYNFIFKMSGNRDLSEDITQEVFYKIVKYRSSYNGGSFKTWMFTIARNSLASHFKKNKQLVAIDKESLSISTDTGGGEDSTQLQYALAQLSETDREVIILNRLQEIKYEELAVMLNSTPGAVKTKVCRALDKLREAYFKHI